MYVLFFAFAIGLLFVLLCNQKNGFVGMYRCNYGGNIFFFLLGGIAGIVIVWALSKSLGQAPKAIRVISRGTIIILGFHKILIHLVRTTFTQSVFDIAFAVLLLLLFIPLIIASEKHFPLLVGKYRVQNI